jgi:hypothetical protein
MMVFKCEKHPQMGIQWEELGFTLCSFEIAMENMAH